MLLIHIAHLQQEQHFTHTGGPIEFGRKPGRPGAYPVKLVDERVSKSQLLIEENASGGIRIENLSQRVPIELPAGARLLPGASQLLNLPARLIAGMTIFDVEQGNEQTRQEALQTISQPVGSGRDAFQETFYLDDAPPVEQLVQWFETVINVQRAAAGSDASYQQTARAVVDLVGLDCGLVLLRESGGWRVVASHSRNSVDLPEFSRTILDQVVEQRRTFFRVDETTRGAESLTNVDSVVASPILDARNEAVVGVVYGACFHQGGCGKTVVRPLDAQLVQVLAAVVGSGLARAASEAEAVRQRIQFEQFVSPEIARELDRDPQLLEARDREITALFVDIRNFSRLSEKIGARLICELVQSVMDRLTKRVREFQGTTISYLGDGLLAMWNAPVVQPDHARLACQAALAMLEDLPLLSEQWRDTVGEPIGIGVGLNTGTAMVGNTGSQLKPQYGPLGHTVNLASRVEGATKHFRVPILITGSTQSQLQGTFATRRLCRVRVVGIREPVDLYELVAESGRPAWCERRDVYESALCHFEASRWDEACQLLSPLLREVDGRYDAPSLALMSRIVDCLRAPSASFDSVWDLLGK